MQIDTSSTQTLEQKDLEDFKQLVLNETANTSPEDTQETILEKFNKFQDSIDQILSKVGRKKVLHVPGELANQQMFENFSEITQILKSHFEGDEKEQPVLYEMLAEVNQKLNALQIN